MMRLKFLFRQYREAKVNIMIEDAKILLIDRYGLNKKIQTRCNNIYEGEKLVLIQNIVTGELKLKPRRR